MKKFYIVISFTLLSFTGWLFFSGSTILAQEGIENVQGKEILNLLADLRNISLDGTIFSDPVFRSLEDFSREIQPQPKGRQNPFAPLGKDIILIQERITGAPEEMPDEEVFIIPVR